MSRLILRRSGRLPPEEADLERLRNISGCQVLDAAGRMLLVEATREGQQQIVATFPDWIITAEQSGISVPDPRPKLKDATDD